ncbi:NAD(P)-binding protein [Hyaloscypha bicolor E]|uniref:NAD(P)-binding protein n=1 Tax=Hyaloscypha bicolor E TaxID=1095630 RepID=A0A2J6SEB5_9HELO|nr:NAD(P)-binding protein [Hyaloscypha bicolor E]PMD49115.1 NAD(P)-binding protein [Hyaloscypha bicolor E]
MQNILITASSGNIGAQLIRKLLATNAVHLVLVTSSTEKLSSFANSNAVTIVEGPLSDPQWVETQLKVHKIDTVFLYLFGIEELFTVFNFLNALQRSPNVKHVVYPSACGDFIGKPENTVGWMCAHTKIKPPVEIALRHIMSFTHTVIGPTLFFENDNKFKDAILQGRRWVEPLGEKGASRVAVADVADAVFIALLDQGRKWDGTKINIGTLKQYAGAESAKLWSNALDFHIQAVPSNQESLDMLEKEFRKKLEPVWARDLTLLYKGIISTGFGISEEEYQLQVKLLGRKPAKYEDYVVKLVQTAG